MGKNEEKPKTELDVLNEINSKLDKLIGVFAIQGKNEDEQIRILKALGFLSNEVSVFTGLKESTIRMRKAWKENQ